MNLQIVLSVHGGGLVSFFSICMKKKCSEVFDILSYM